MDPHRLVSLFAPPRCLACGAPPASSQSLCPTCAARLSAARPGTGVVAVAGRRLDVHWASEYAGIARELVRALKFARHTSAAVPIARALAPLVASASALVPVPAAPWRRRLRGFDPAEEIAVALGRTTGIEVLPCLRRRSGRRQVGRSRADRLAHPPRMRLAGPAPAAAVLVDDVLTTGATLAACAQALDVSVVSAVVFARALGPTCTRA